MRSSSMRKYERASTVETLVIANMRITILIDKTNTFLGP